MGSYRFAGLRLHPVVPQVALLALVHLRISLTLLTLVPPAHSGFALVKVELGATIKVASTVAPCRIVMPRALNWAFFGHKDLLHQLVLLQQVAESQDRRLIRDPVTDQLDAGKAALGGYLNQIQKPANWCLWKHYAFAGPDDLSPLRVEKLIPSGSELR